MFSLHDVHHLEDLEVDKLRVFVRADLDCPVERDGSVIDDSKLKALVPTLRFLLEKEAAVVLAGHLGSVLTKPPASLSLADCGVRLAGMLETELYLPDQNLGPMARKLLREQRPGHIVLLENLAFDEGERQRSEDYARELIAPFELCVVDGLFGTLDTASVSIAPKLCQQRAMGPLLRGQLAAVNQLLDAGAGRSVWCIGDGFTTRERVLERALARRAHVLPGVDLALPLLSASGKDVPLTDAQKAEVSRARTWLQRATSAGAKVQLPSDFLVVAGSEVLSRNVADLRPSERIIDLGPVSTVVAAKIAADARVGLLLDRLGAKDARHPDAWISTRQVLQAVSSAASPENWLLGEHHGLAPGLDGVAESQRRRLNHFASSNTGLLDSLSGARSPSLEALRIPL